jgi:hypothetical protein
MNDVPVTALVPGDRHVYSLDWITVPALAGWLRRLQEEGGNGNCLVIALEGDHERPHGYYIQFISEPGQPQVYAEVSSNDFLMEEDQLSPAQLARFGALGWKRGQPFGPEGKANLMQFFPAEDAAERLKAAQAGLDAIAVLGLEPHACTIVVLALESL